MSSVKGGQFHSKPANVHAQIAKAIHDNAKKTAAAKPGADSAKAAGKVHVLPASLAHLASHDTVAGLDRRTAQSLHDTVASGHASKVGFDTVASLARGSATFAGSKHAPVEKVVATQTVHKDGVTVHFADGSALHVAGVTHLHGGFFHH